VGVVNEARKRGFVTTAQRFDQAPIVGHRDCAHGSSGNPACEVGVDAGGRAHAAGERGWRALMPPTLSTSRRTTRACSSPTRASGPALARVCSDPDDRVRFLVRDQDRKFARAFDEVFRSEAVRVLRRPVRAPRANAYAERWVRTVRTECLDWLLILNRTHLERVLRVYARCAVPLLLGPAAAEPGRLGRADGAHGPRPRRQTALMSAIPIAARRDWTVGS
jgi:hypothetical protein